MIALRYLGDLSYAEIAAFAGISESAARKRTFSARQRLKEMMPVISDQLARARPSLRAQLTDSVLLFAAIRHHDHKTVAALLDTHIQSWSTSARPGHGSTPSSCGCGTRRTARR